MQERSVQTPAAQTPERHCSLPVHGLQEPAVQTAPGAQSSASRQPSTGGRAEETDDDEGTSTTGVREDTAALETAPVQTMQGKSGVTAQDLP